ncbi:MAG: dockerin type I repeat-containing protein, partial [Ruminococcus sp.]|nr:dockerin type I repeat-containing protein [Ruminococcus sp.]
QNMAMYSGIKSVTIPPTVKVIGAYPAKTRTEFMSGMGDIPGRRPLTDEPICAFNADCVVYGYTGTEAERYAEEWGLEFVPLEYTEGDANFDGKFTVADVVAVQGNILGKRDSGMVYWKAADMNSDGELDAFDFCELRQRLRNGI